MYADIRAAKMPGIYLSIPIGDIMRTGVTLKKIAKCCILIYCKIYQFLKSKQKCNGDKKEKQNE
jgi:hypothetical protein